MREGKTGLTYKELLRRRPLVRVLGQTPLNHVLQDLREGIALGQLRRRLMHNLLQQIQDPRWRTVPILDPLTTAKREPPNRHLHDTQPVTPHIRLDRVPIPLDPLGRHVRRGAHKGVGDGVDELARDAEIAELDAAAGVDEDVGGLDVAMHDVVVGVEVGQAAEGRLGDLAEDVDADGAEVAGDGVEGADRVSVDA